MNEVMREALKALNRAIGRGEEFPDALYQMSEHFSVPADALKGAYDQQFMEQGQ